MLAIDVGPIQIQPAEFAKFVVLLAMCAYLSDDRSRRGVSYPRFLGALIIVGIPAVLVIVQPDLGSGSVLIAMTMGVLLVAGAKARYIAAISVLSLATRRRRLRRQPGQPVPAASGCASSSTRTTPTSQDEVYQVTNAVRAVGTGGHLRQGVAAGPAHERARHPGDLGRLPVRRRRRAVRPRRVRGRCCSCSPSCWCGSGASPACRGTCSAPTSAPACSRCCSGRCSRTSG